MLQRDIVGLPTAHYPPEDWALVETGFLRWTPRRTVLRSSYTNVQRSVA